MKRIITLIKQHDEASFGIGLLIAVILVGTFIYSYMHHLHTKARNQAVARAKKMDGKTFTIGDVSWNFVGDTKLILKNDCGQNVGSIMMYMANPLDMIVNPLSLAFTDPSGRLPFPMKVRAHFRQDPWILDYDGSSRDTFTGSFIKFEVLKRNLMKTIKTIDRFVCRILDANFTRKTADVLSAGTLAAVFLSAFWWF